MFRTFRILIVTAILGGTSACASPAPSPPGPTPDEATSAPATTTTPDLVVKATLAAQSGATTPAAPPSTTPSSSTPVVVGVSASPSAAGPIPRDLEPSHPCALAFDDSMTRLAPSPGDARWHPWHAYWDGRLTVADEDLIAVVTLNFQSSPSWLDRGVSYALATNLAQRWRFLQVGKPPLEPGPIEINNMKPNLGPGQAKGPADPLENARFTVSLSPDEVSLVAAGKRGERALTGTLERCARS